MKTKIIVAGLSVAMLLVSGCGTVKVNQGSAPAVPPVGTTEAESEIVRSRIPVSVKSIGAADDGFAQDVAGLVEGELAAGGFAVVQSNPHISVTLKPDVNLFDKFGNYYVYEGRCGINVLRQDGKTLSRDIVQVKGDRTLEEQRALLSTRKKLSAEVGDKVVKVCTEKVTGIESVIVILTRVKEGKIKAFSAELRRRPGVYSCNRVEEEGKTVKYRVIYDRKKFPDGIRTVVLELI